MRRRMETRLHLTKNLFLLTLITICSFRFEELVPWFSAYTFQSKEGQPRKSYRSIRYRLHAVFDVEWTLHEVIDVTHYCFHFYSIYQIIILVRVLWKLNVSNIAIKIAYIWFSYGIFCCTNFKSKIDKLKYY